jgi:hypothetical protein
MAAAFNAANHFDERYLTTRDALPEGLRADFDARVTAELNGMLAYRDAGRAGELRRRLDVVAARR